MEERKFTKEQLEELNAVTCNINAMAKARNILFGINVLHFPTDSNLHEMASFVTLSIIDNKEVTNEFYTAITEIKQDWYTKYAYDVDFLREISVRFFQPTSEWLLGLMRKLSLEKKKQNDMDSEKMINKMTGVLAEIMKVNPENIELDQEETSS